VKIDRRLLQLTGGIRGYLALTVALGLLTGVLAVAQAALLSRIVDAVFLAGQALGPVSGLLGGLLAVIVGRAVLLGVSDGTAARAAGRAKRALREPLVAHLLALGPHYVHDERSGELSNVAGEGVETLDAYFGQFLPQAFLTVLVPLTVVVAVFSADLLSGVVLLLTAPALPIFMVLIGKMADSLTKRQWRLLSHMSAHFLDVLQGLSTLKLLGRSGRQTAIIARISERYRAATLGVLRVAFLSALVLEIGATISTAIVAVEVGLRLLYGQMPFQQAFFVLLLAPEFYLPFRALGARFHAAMGGGAAAGRIFAILEQPLPSAPAAPVDPRPLLARGPLTFEAVSYEYGERSPSARTAAEPAPRPALTGISFAIAPGQVTALVGPSGAGKSTVAHLLLRFIEPTGGMIRLADTPLTDVAAAAWRAQIGWVPQHPYLFHDTVAANIRLGRPAAALANVVAAARAAQAHDFITALPHGYETVIGEQGARLSGGEAQRLGLARAFLKDAPLLILDEATAHLDPDHEAALMDAVTRLMQGRTVLIIAHRLSTVYRADKVVVLDGGRVVQVGSPQALAQEAGIYRQLILAQAGGG
jgi:ATP-binding cassette subfamily C protein CydD